VLEQNKAIVRRLLEELSNTGNPDVADEVFTPGYVDHTPSNPGLSGIENAKKSVRDWRAAFPDTLNTVEDMIAEGDGVAAHWIKRATHRGEFMGIPQPATE
jgi:predicted ester cyclase